MKKIFNVLFILCFSTITFISCSDKTNNEIQIKENNLYNKILSNNISIVTTFSKELALTGFLKGIDVIDKNSSLIYLKLNNNGKLFLNGESVDISKTIYTMEQIDNEYFFTNTQLDYSLSKQIENDKYWLIYEGKRFSLSGANFFEINQEIERDLAISLNLIRELSEPDLNQTFSSYPTLRNGKVKECEYEGTGFGAHTNLSDAKKFCQEDYNEILSDHPDWESAGVSYSCLWGQHLCICTANFYSNCD